MLKAIDLHSHSNNAEKDIFSITNVHQLEKKILNKYQSYSIGLHPWYITKENYKEDLEWVEAGLGDKQALLLGECGLDRLRGEDLDFQQKIFEQQLDLADHYQKPVIIHCVKAFQELVVSVKKVKPKVPLIIHGFNKKKSLFIDLEKEGFLFSFGKAILNEKSPAYQIIQNINKELFFLETDASGISIKKIYEQAAFLRNSELNDILATVLENTRKLGIDV